MANAAAVWLTQRDPPPVRYFAGPRLGQLNIGDAPQGFCGSAHV
jgi:hypothetical protein